MTSLVAPLIPPKVRKARAGRSGRSLPAIGYRHVSVPRLMASRGRSSTYGFAAIDDRGRIAARLIFGSLGWVPGTSVTIREHGGLVVLSADRRGPIRVSPKGHLRLPAPIRRWCGLEAGSRVLLVADPHARRLVVHPPAALDAMISRYYADVFGGDAA